jgi:S-adenosylmethionine-diacylglycerol 3-amino-3-carboxypropyl transferase
MRETVCEAPLPAAQSPGELAGGADVSILRYAQCWEDADVLLAGLDVQPGDTCLSIASAGDNALALLTRDPARVIALDVSPAQLACLELRVAAYRTLEHAELLELVGSVPSSRRHDHYRRCRALLSPEARAFWDTHPRAIAAGIGGAGRFERYLALFRERVLPLAHPRSCVEQLLAGGSRTQREAFYAGEWNTWRWRLLFHLFFSRLVMGRIGRDPRFFRYVEGSVADHVLERTRHALTALDPAANPYLQWILTGEHRTALPYALRPEHFQTVRCRLDRLEWRRQSLEAYLEEAQPGTVDRFNLSDVFEYVPMFAYERTLERLARVGRPGARLVYWNMLAPRQRPAHLADRLEPQEELAAHLHRQDKAFFYHALVVEEVC